MKYAIWVSVNSDQAEYDYNLPKEASLDAAMSRILEQYPNCTSVVMSIVPYAEGYPAKF